MTTARQDARRCDVMNQRRGVYLLLEFFFQMTRFPLRYATHFVLPDEPR